MHRHLAGPFDILTSDADIVENFIIEQPHLTEGRTIGASVTVAQILRKTVNKLSLQVAHNPGRCLGRELGAAI